MYMVSVQLWALTFLVPFWLHARYYVSVGLVRTATTHIARRVA
jgi:hypothetical protein